MTWYKALLWVPVGVIYIPFGILIFGLASIPLLMAFGVAEPVPVESAIVAGIVLTVAIGAAIAYAVKRFL